jgi:hypothetical protein
MIRTPFDGKPFYCLHCGGYLGGDIPCQGQCRMESKEQAQLRAKAVVPAQKDDIDLVNSK